MMDQFNESLKNEGVISCEQSEPLDFSALNTFDSSNTFDSGNYKEGKQSIDLSIILPKFSDDKFSDDSNFHPGMGVNFKESEQITNDRNQLIASRLSSNSIEDSFGEQKSHEKGNRSSIFRPKPIEKDEHFQRDHATRKPSHSPHYHAHGSSGVNHQSERVQFSPQTQKPSYKNSRQVSVTDSRTMSARQSFDSFGEKSYMRDLTYADSMASRRKIEMSFEHTFPEKCQKKAEQNQSEGGDSYDRVIRDRKHGRDDSPIGGTNKRGNCAPSAFVTPMRIQSPKIVNYHMVLRSRAKIFTDFTFLLPDLKMCVINYASSKKHQWDNGSMTYGDVVARRRLVSAVQAYGGNMFDRSLHRPQNNSSSNFRSNAEDFGTRERNNDLYDQHLLSRYYENCGRLSWDVEENPPVASAFSGPLRHVGSDQSKASVTRGAEDRNTRAAGDQEQSAGTEADEGLDEAKSESGETPKMRYRCKLCGQPKQNHVCSYQQALERSIGTMSYVAVNAFQAKESGKLAPSLSDMNNFVDLENEDEDEDGNKIVPNIEPLSKRAVESLPYYQVASEDCVGRRRKRRAINAGNREKYKGDERLFHTPMEIKPEQCRQVSMRTTCRIEGFKYPTVPLTFHQRKNASEDLFELCQGIPGLTDDCSKILGIARESKSWDLAIAELITQILVVAYCPPSDEMLEGLKRHLMTMGFSC